MDRRYIFYVNAFNFSNIVGSSINIYFCQVSVAENRRQILDVVKQVRPKPT